MGRTPLPCLLERSMLRPRESARARPRFCLPSRGSSSLLLAVAAALPGLAAGLCETPGDHLKAAVAEVSFRDLSLQVLCGEDGPAAAGRAATARRTHDSFLGHADVVELARAFSAKLGETAGYSVPATLDQGLPSARPRTLRTGGQYSRRAHEFARKNDFGPAIADVARALLRDNVDSTAQDKLSKTLDRFLEQAKKKIEQASADGDLSELFEDLGLEDVQTDVDLKKLKRNYRELSVKYHPDKSPQHAQRFNRIRDAYEILSDPVKVLLYDTGGPELVRKYEGGRDDVERGENMEQRATVSLKDVYLGKQLTISPSRRVVCLSCRRRPDLPRCKQCRKCPGETRQRQIWMNPHQYRIEEYEEPSKDFCQSVKQELSVAIDKGAMMGDRVQFPNKGPQKPGEIPGDILVTIKIEKHPFFQRVGNDLYVTLKVSLMEALLGFERELEHLDGHKVNIGIPRGTVLRPNAGMVIDGEGMPLREDPSSYGRLVVKFEIQFPPSIPEESAGDLEKALQASGSRPMPGRIQVNGRHTEL
eukprot:TRINITY_DN64411_c0_g1_i1.p1 TRINITY_DN64411_c0_g1~~TRINITY_DN64411_c0_g1_i1.p1  ORF type:complete len:546 (+),score=130.97 TRINITY_DN64411_c0_g1_i1:41-1639(+)